MMSNLLKQAQAAAQQKNWSLLTQYLQQVGTGEEEGEALSEREEGRIAHPLPSDLEQVLALALKVLEWGDFQDRWEIAKVIVLLGTPAIAPITAIVENEEADLEQRWFALRILGEFNRPEAIAPLLELLKTSESEELCTQAANTIASLGPAAIDALTALLATADSRLFATAALAQIRRPETIEPLLSVARDPLPEVRATAIEALSSFPDPRIVPVLVEGLTDVAASVRKEAATGLGVRPYLNDTLDLVNLLKPLLWDIRWEVCQQAAIALSRLKTEAAAAALFELLLSPAAPEPLKIEAVRALGWMETATALGYLQQALMGNEEGEIERIIPNFSLPLLTEMAMVLGRVEPPDLKAKAAQVLVDFLNTGGMMGDRVLKQALVTALGQLGDTRAIEALIPLLADADASVRLHCLVALKQLDPETAHQLEKAHLET